MPEELRADIAAAVKQMGSRWAARKELRMLPSHLWEGELVSAVVGGTFGPGNGVLAMTDRRLIYVFDGAIRKHTEDFPYDRITSIAWHAGMLLRKIEIYSAGAKIEITNVDKQTGKTFVDMARETVARANNSQGPKPSPRQSMPEAAAVDPYEHLRQLSSLHDAGVLTSDEYAAAKARIVERL